MTTFRFAVGAADSVNGCLQHSTWRVEKHDQNRIDSIAIEGLGCLQKRVSFSNRLGYCVASGTQ
jgi:hypothetical protein